MNTEHAKELFERMLGTPNIPAKLWGAYQEAKRMADRIDTSLRPADLIVLVIATGLEDAEESAEISANWSEIPRGSAVIVQRAGKRDRGVFLEPGKGDNVRIKIDGDEKSYREIPAKNVRLSEGG